jgi:hypothetical protein
MIRTEEQHLAHYGILRRSGRYPWGSGATESARNKSFLDIVNQNKKAGMSEAEIAKAHGISVADLRAARSIAIHQQRQEKQLTAQRLKEKGWSNVAIGERMGINESSVRALLAPGAKDKADVLRTTSNMLKRQVDEKGMIDVGGGVEHQVGVTRTRLDTAVAMLKEQGYTTHVIKVQQLGTGKYTNLRVLAKPGISKSDVQKNRAEIRQIQEYSDDHGRTFVKVQPPLNINSRRIGINYKEDGGDKADGVIYVRPGVPDVRIGNKRYGQVRIAVDGTHYLKGMAIYKEDLPPGVDLVFNTKQRNTGRKKDVMKTMSDDPDLPFGAIVRQVHDSEGKVISVMNMVGSKEGAGEEGSWDTWSKTLPSQMLSKQSPTLAKQQLKMTYERRIKEFNEVNSLTNPTVRKDLLLRFGDSTDSDAVHLKAAALPRQATKVLLPVPSMKPNEIYATSFRDGERVALIRFPHGGTFEIPELTVNNRNREARKLLGPNPQDAVGIHHKVAERLSGADFDGDTVLVIPNNRGMIKSTPALEGLKGFDPMVYKIPEGSLIPRVTSSRKGYEMGNVSNLITDMTIRGANTEQLARAIRHSMVVIDSEKHQLDYRQSEKDHGILALKEEYQGSKRAGAQTLISRASSPVRIPDRIERPARRGGPIDPETGKKVFEPTGRMIPVRKRVVDPITGKKVSVETGRLVPKTIEVRRLALEEDAFALNPGTTMERIYAEHSNRLKALANTARKEAIHIKPAPYSPSAKKVYSSEVSSIKAKLQLAERNAPYERQAQLLANAHVAQRRQANPGMEADEVKKIKQQALTNYRARTGASKTKIRLTQAEWNAIQAGAVSTNVLEKVLINSDMDSIKMLALPKNAPKMSNTMRTRAQSMLASGATQAEVADALGVGLTTLKTSIGE